jgi:hypothetical protein
MCLDARGLKVHAKPIVHKKPIKAWKSFAKYNDYHNVKYDNKFIKCLDGEFRNVPFVTEKPSKSNKPTELPVYYSAIKVGQVNKETSTGTIYVTHETVADPNDPNMTISKEITYSKGYHVCLTEADAKKYVNEVYGGGLIIPVMVNEIVAEGTQLGANCMVVRELYVDPADVPDRKDRVLEQHEAYRKDYKY